MARCQRCHGCESQWAFEPCKFCGWPGEDTRTLEVIAQDEKDWEEFCSED